MKSKELFISLMRVIFAFLAAAVFAQLNIFVLKLCIRLINLPQMRVEFDEIWHVLNNLNFTWWKIMLFTLAGIILMGFEAFILFWRTSKYYETLGKHAHKKNEEKEVYSTKGIATRIANSWIGWSVLLIVFGFIFSLFFGLLISVLVAAIFFISLSMLLGLGYTLAAFILFVWVEILRYNRKI